MAKKKTAKGKKLASAKKLDKMQPLFRHR